MTRLFALFLLIFSVITFSQQRPGGTISGKVLDENSGAPIEYANVVLFKASDSTQVTGSVTNPEGIFEIKPVPPGNFYLDIVFMGYERKRIIDLSINRNNPAINIGEVKISPTSINLGDVVVESDRSPVTYEIDKKVIDVEQFSTSLSGNAAEVLENVPSITVDIEGNVSLRGNSNFTLLIDGRPTVMDPQDALQQIPASTIKNIEIITNPSAKYNPEGTAGIINIILKKNRSAGISGLMNLNAGLRDKIGGDMLLEYKGTSVNLLAGLDYSNMFFPVTGIEENRYTFNGNTTFINSNGEGRYGRNSFGLRVGAEFILGSSDFLNIGTRYRNREGQRNSSSNYIEWSETDLRQKLRRNLSDRSRGGESYELSANYVHKFNGEGHELTADVSYEYQDSDEFTVSEIYDNQVLTEGTRTTEAGPDNEINSRLNYVISFDEKNKFEAGYQGEIEVSKENSRLFEYNSTSGVYDLQSDFSRNVRYETNEHAFYSIYTGAIGKFGYQGGLRGEYTKRNIILTVLGNEFLIDRLDFFPTVHTSYEFSAGQQIMASYTRRLNRPRGWALEPFITWIDANNIRQGNPSLLPEFIDSYELAAQTYIGDVSISTEFYYSITNNKIEDIRSVYSENVTLTTFGNVGKDYSLGTEFLLNFDVEKIWNVNLMGNLYDYKVEGVLYGEPFSRSSFNWRTRVNNVIKLGSTQFQVTASYNSPSVSSQGTREGFFTSDIAVKQEFLDKKLSLTLQIRDLLSTAKYESTTIGNGFYRYSQFSREAPMVMLNIRYSINNFKPERNRDRGEGFGEDDEL